MRRATWPAGAGAPRGSAYPIKGLLSIVPRFCRILFCLFLVLAPATVAAQSAGNVVTPSPPPREGTVGPEQLRDFALPGTRTAPSQADRPEANEPRPTSPAPRQAPPSASAEPAPARSAPAPTPRREEVVQAPADGDVPVGSPSPSNSVTLPLPDAVPALPVAVEQVPPPAAVLPAPPSTASNLSFGWWPWALAAAVAGAALFLFMRRRQAREEDVGRLAFVGMAGAPPKAEHKPSPPPRPEAAPPPKADPLPSGLVTTRLNRESVAASSAPAAPPSGLVASRLRPWLDLDIQVLGMSLSDEGAVITFELELLNTGNAPARDVVVEMVPLNAGENQEAELATFFERPMDGTRGIEVIAPLGRMSLRNEVRMPRAAIREYGVDGARVFVPILAFNGAYRWSGGEGRTSAAWLIGRAANGSGKLGPLRLDQGPRQFGAMSQKRLEAGVRR